MGEGHKCRRRLRSTRGIARKIRETSRLMRSGLDSVSALRQGVRWEARARHMRFFCCKTRFACPSCQQQICAIKMKQQLFLTLLAAATLALSSCSSTVYGPIDDKTQGVTYEKGVPGGTVVETYKVTATVTGIDAPARKVTLVAQDGKETTVKCGPN